MPCQRLSVSLNPVKSVRLPREKVHAARICPDAGPGWSGGPAGPGTRHQVTHRKDAKKGPAKNTAKASEDALTQTKTAKKTALANVRSDIKAIGAAEKNIDKEMEKKNTFIAGLLSKITILENKMTLAVQNELAKVHTKSTTVLENLSNWFSSTFTLTGERLGHRLGTKGGQKSRQNKQQHQKKYTKRYKKKIYRKRTQKHLKIKRRRHTKRRK